MKNLYYLLQIALSSFGLILYISASRIIRNEFGKRLNDISIQQDKGLIYVSYAMIVWILAGIFHFLFPGRLENQVFHNLIRSFLSSLNNMFFLLAINYFDNLPAGIQNIQIKLNDKIFRWDKLVYFLTVLT